MPVSVDIYVPCFNEERIIPYLHKWYAHRLPGASFHIFDNESSDNTVAAALDLGCTVTTFSTSGQYDEGSLRDLRNSAWKTSTAEYVIVCDADEFLEVDEVLLGNQKPVLVKGIGYNMFGDGTQSLDQIDRGLRNTWYDKWLCFRPDSIIDMRLSEGSHTAQPEYRQSSMAENFVERPLYHYRAFDVDDLVAKFRRNAERMSAINRERNWGTHYLTQEPELREKYRRSLLEAEIINPQWY
ncbi:MAG: glycosyltransferase family 2 protein [Actinomycetes bacterium]